MLIFIGGLISGFGFGFAFRSWLAMQWHKRALEHTARGGKYEDLLSAPLFDDKEPIE